MISDMITIIWKEIKELFTQKGKFRGGSAGMLLFIGVFGIYMPLQSGRGWVTSPLGLVFWVWVPFLLVSSVIADTFAGERERHTLETLLSSRLSDRSILFGKIAAAVAYGWGLTMLCVVLGLVSLNLVYGGSGLLLYPADIGLGIIIVTFLIATLAAALGVLISLHASSVRQAQQTFSVAFFVVFIPLFLLPILPVEWRQVAAQWLLNMNIPTLIVVAIGFLSCIDAALLALAIGRFQRARLILD